jgi:hypothetical protein
LILRDWGLAREQAEKPTQPAKKKEQDHGS